MKRPGLPPWTLVLVPMAAAALAMYKTGQWDYWFHLAAGRSIALHGLPERERWCLSAYGQWPWLGEWLFHLALYGIRSAAGEWGVSLWRALWAMGAVALTLRIAREAGSGTGTLLALAPLVLATFRGRQDPRPEQVSLVFTLVFVWRLERRSRAGWRGLWGMLALQALWANLHAMWILGPAMVALYAALSALGRRRARAWGLVGFAVALVAVAVLATPRPLDTLSLRVLRDAWSDPARGLIDELRPWSWRLDHAGAFTMLLAVALAAAALGGAVAWRASRGLTVLAVAALAAGVAVFRQQAPAALLALPAVASALSGASAAWRLRTSRVVAGLAFAAGLVALARDWRGYELGIGPLAQAVPVRAVEVADSLQLEGPVLNTSWYGGYILWARGDDHPPLVDTRNLGDPAFRSRYRRASSDSTAFDSLASAWRFTHAIVQPPGMDRGGLALQLAGREEWAAVFADDAGWLFVSRRAYPEIAASRGYRWLTPDYERLGMLARRSLADTALAHGLLAELERARADSPWNVGATYWLGLVRLSRGEFEEAARLLGEVERRAPLTPGLSLRLGMALEGTGDSGAARAAYRRALREPADAAAARDAIRRLGE